MKKAATVLEHRSGKVEIGLQTNISTSILPKIKEEIKMELSDYLRAYEEQHKKPPTQAAVRFAAWLNDAGKKFGRIGFGDGHHHKQPLDDSIFTDWARRYFADDAETLELCADFVRGCYHDGLAEGRAIA